jgi:hypothetical protein
MATQRILSAWLSPPHPVLWSLPSPSYISIFLRLSDSLAPFLTLRETERQRERARENERERARETETETESEESERLRESFLSLEFQLVVSPQVSPSRPFLSLSPNFA